MLLLLLLVAPLSHGWLHSVGPQLLDSGRDVKLRCVNWYGAHQETFAAGGLELRSCAFIADHILLIGANCVRIPLSVQLVRDNPIPPYWAVSESGCERSTALGILDCQVEELTSRGIMVILNSHTSFAGWVGSNEVEQQGLWHYPGFPTSDWLSSLVELARRYRNNSLVVGIDIRNEIHDQGGTVITWGESGDADRDWKAATMMADAAIRAVNPDVLVIVSGLCRGYDLRAMQDLKNYRFKFVFTTHVYTYSWWFLLVDWNAVLAATSAVVAVSVVCMCMFVSSYRVLEKRDPFCWLYVFASSVVLPVVGVGVSTIWMHVSQQVGCSTIAAEAVPAFWISVVWLSLGLSCWCVLLVMENFYNWRLLWSCVCAWNICMGLVLIGLSLWFQTYAAVEWELRRWRSQDIPVLVGEFGTRVGDTRVVWRWLVRYVQGLHYSYWAINGRKWDVDRWDNETFGLLTPDWGGVRDVNWTRTIFPS